MKIIKAALIVAGLLILVAVVGTVVFIKTFDVNRFKPQIIAQAKAALGRDVDFGKARLDIGFRGISLKLDTLVVSDDPAFQKEAFVTVKGVAVAVDALAYLTRKTISVPVVIIQEPRITLIRDKDGRLNVQTIAGSLPAAPVTETVPQGEAGLFIPNAYAQSGPAPAALPAVSVGSFKVVKGTVLFIDRSFAPQMAVEVKDLDITLNRFSLSEAFPFAVAASVFSRKQNISANGTVQLDLKANAVSVSGLKVSSDLADLVLEELPRALPMLKGVSLPTALAGKLEVSVPKVFAGAKGLGALQGEVTLTGGSVALKELAAPLKDIVVKATASEKDLVLEKAQLNLGSGRVSASGKIAEYAGSQTYSLQAQVKDLNVEEVLEQEKAAVKAEGLVGADISASGSGFTAEAVKSNLSGTVAADIIKAKLKDINVLRLVLDKVDAVVPGISSGIEAGLPQKFKDGLSAKDTSFLDMKLPVTIQDGEVVIKDTALVSEMFSFKGTVRSTLTGRYVLEGDFIIPQELSAAMAAAQPKLKYLFNAGQMISLPLKVKGSAAGGPQFSVDSEYILKRLVAEQGTQQLFKAIDKELGDSGDAAAVKGAVSNILGNILGK